ncbi:MAG: hypothetical protein CVU38_09705 [Chloroflexi bacterium HGW-Chloroflexi-1]|nr:MAG: hypothetical protein CVU38_09705 [Chloroflexi bacterium HGW-Chloroflexi-1]
MPLGPGYRAALMHSSQLAWIHMDMQAIQRMRAQIRILNKLLPEYATVSRRLILIWFGKGVDAAIPGIYSINHIHMHGV